MARAKSPAGEKTPQQPSATEARWARVTWDDLGAWAGAAAVARGREYQATGHVRDLTVTEDGDLLATVAGGEPYATTVSLGFGTSPTLDSTCTCFVGFRCKHAVAVVAEYIGALVNDRPVPIAADEDPRWDELEAGDAGHHAADGGRTSAEPAPADNQWDDRILDDLRGRSHSALVDLAWSLIRRFPEAYQEFRNQIALVEGDIAELLAEARREVGKATGESASGRSRSGGSHSPNFELIRQLLDQLLKLGQADAVAMLGRDLIAEGIERIAERTDEGEEFEDLKPCFPIIRRAVLGSKLSGLDRLRFAVDADIADGYDVLDGSMTPILDAAETADWSKLADHLLGRLGQGAAPRERDGSGREQITRWLIHALDRAGRGGEVQAVYEREAHLTGRYDKLVAHLIALDRLDDAERWATVGIAARAEKAPGDAAQLAEQLRAIAERRKRWDVAAAFAARDFFANPSSQLFERLMAAALKAGVAAPVRSTALSFLETGNPPYRVETPPRSSAKPPRGKGKSASPTPNPGPPTDRIWIADDWPLPVPAALIPLLKRRDPMVAASGGPHLDVLLQMALKSRDPDQILAAYDRLRAQPAHSRDFSLTTAYADTVAEAIGAAHPDRAIAILTDRLNARLPQAETVAYEASVGYLRKLRPLYAAANRPADWDALVASIREQYRNRSRFLELLDRLEPQTIAASARRKPK